MIKLTLACATFLSATMPVFAESNVLMAGKTLSETIFGSMETNSEGAVDMCDFVSFGRNIFGSMDANDDESIDFEEFTIWDFGFNFVSEDVGEKIAYETAQRVLFAYWDHDRDGEIGKQEYHKSLVSDFRRADIDNDAFLTREEFLQGYVVIDTYRAAIADK